MKMLTFLPLEEINEYAKLEGSDINKAKEVLAYEITKLIHGTEEADKALKTARQVFAAGAISSDMPTTELSDSDFTDGKIAVVDMMIKAKLAPSKGEARRLIQQGGVTLCGEKVTELDASLEASAFDGNEIVIKKGKKVYHRFTRG